MANKKEDLAGQPDEFLKGVSVHHDAVLLGPAPKVIQDEQAKPEDCIPDLPENKEVRDFLKKAPTKGLWMPLGKEVKVMQCWRCKAYGHRTGDRECPLSESGNPDLERERQMRLDPMRHLLGGEQGKSDLQVKKEIKETKTSRIQELQKLLEMEKKKRKEKKQRKKEHKEKSRKRKRSSSPDEREHKHKHKEKKHKHKESRDRHRKDKKEKKRRKD